FNIKYISYCLQSLDLAHYKQGAAIPHIYFRDYGEYEVNVEENPDDQQRIVSFLDAGFEKIEALKSNAANQLQAAKDMFQAALKELLTPKEGWVEKKLGDLCSICGEYGLNESASEYNGVRYIRITDITDDGELNNNKVSANNANQKKQDKLEVGDILFARTGATVGKTLVYRKDFGECVFAGYLIRYRTNPNIILPKFLFYFTHSNEYYEWVKNNQAAAAQPNISAQKYNGLVIPFPNDTKVQQQIAAQLDELSAKIKSLQSNYDQTITLCNDLKQALLKQIFE
ncbi:MAG: restriction endonuclease subunit S, partial [Bacteroidales bacterium]|nr:restriction endonuclease subunit S [Bacteroidales bacterium]